MKVIALLPRPANLSREEFERYAREAHTPRVTRFPELRRLVCNFVLPGQHGPAPAYDAVFEVWFDDAAGMGARFPPGRGKRR